MQAFDFVPIDDNIRVHRSDHSYQVVKSSGHSFCVNPQLPFARMPVPRLAHVIPFEQLLRVVYPVHSMSVDSQRVVRFVGRVFNPRVYNARLTRICKKKKKRCIKKQCCSIRDKISNMYKERR